MSSARASSLRVDRWGRCRSRSASNTVRWGTPDAAATSSSLRPRASRARRRGVGESVCGAMRATIARRGKVAAGRNGRLAGALVTLRRFRVLSGSTPNDKTPVYRGLHRWPGQDSNLRATDYESAALTTELPGRARQLAPSSGDQGRLRRCGAPTAAPDMLRRHAHLASGILGLGDPRARSGRRWPC